jgi:hypothetical protein
MHTQQHGSEAARAPFPRLRLRVRARLAAEEAAQAFAIAGAEVDALPLQPVRAQRRGAGRRRRRDGLRGEEGAARGGVGPVAQRARVRRNSRNRRRRHCREQLRQAGRQRHGRPRRRRHGRRVGRRRRRRRRCGGEVGGRGGSGARGGGLRRSGGVAARGAARGARAAQRDAARKRRGAQERHHGCGWLVCTHRGEEEARAGGWAAARAPRPTQRTPHTKNAVVPIGTLGLTNQSAGNDTPVVPIASTGNIFPLHPQLCTMAKAAALLLLAGTGAASASVFFEEKFETGARFCGECTLLPGFGSPFAQLPSGGGAGRSARCEAHRCALRAGIGASRRDAPRCARGCARVRAVAPQRGSARPAIDTASGPSP